MSHLEDIRIATDLEMDFNCHQTGVSSFILKCKGKTTQLLECSRSLKDYGHEVNLQFDILIELDAKAKSGFDIDNMEDEAYEICVNSNNPDFDISEIIRQEILIQEPMIPLNPDTESNEWLEVEEKEETEKIDPRWEALKKLKLGSQDSSD